MIVRVQLFARARELARSGHIEVSLADGSTVADLRRRLAEEYPALREIVARSFVAVDEQYADDDQQLKPGQPIALVPPVSGGG